MRISNTLIIGFFVYLTTMCHAQNKDLLYNELHFEDGLCKNTIKVTPTGIMRASWTDTACFHRKQPISMLSFLYKGQEYALYIEPNLEESMADSIIYWVDNLCQIEISILFFQSCAEPYVLNNKFYPLGIITCIRRYSYNPEDVR